MLTHQHDSSMMKMSANDNENQDGRRNFLSKLAVSTAFGWSFLRSDAQAAGGFLSGLKMPDGGGGDDKNKNKKRLGGTVNKIRIDVGHIMVCIITKKLIVREQKNILSLISSLSVF